MNRAELCCQCGERGATARLGAERHRWVSDKRPATLLGEDQPLVTELAIGALHGHELHAKVLGELASRRELVSRAVLAIGARDLLAEPRGDLLGRGRLLGRFWALLHGFESSRT